MNECKRSSAVFSPSQFLHYIRLNPQFSDSTHEDAQELLMYTLNTCMEILQKEWKQEQLDQFQQQQLQSTGRKKSHKRNQTAPAPLNISMEQQQHQQQQQQHDPIKQLKETPQGI